MRQDPFAAKSWFGRLFLGGFRPFFLAAALWAALAIGIWPPFLAGEIDLWTAFSPVDWHAHEMIYGYGAAVIAGFLLTAIPSWTGRLPIAGLPLAALAALWAAGRCAVVLSSKTGWILAGALDLGFLFVFAAVAAREIVAGKNVRNLKVVALILILAVANAGFHVEAALDGAASVSSRVGLAVIVLLILLIGGRVVPSFTHNWLAKQGNARRPVPLSRTDGVIMVLSAVSLVLWIAAPDVGVVGGLLLGTGAANAWRLSRWQGWVARSDRLVLILHIGFLLTVLGFFCAGAHALMPGLVSPAATTHVWAVGGVGTMTLAMMTRVTLGHTGRTLTASLATQCIYFALIVAMTARVAMEFLPSLASALLYGAATAWIVAFCGFVAVYGPLLAGRRP